MCLTSFQLATANVSKDRPSPYFLTQHLGTHALITLIHEIRVNFTLAVAFHHYLM